MVRPLAGAVTSEQARASRIGTDILQAGGNAIDAIIATIIAVNTLCPYHSDLGGGGFALLRLPSGKYESLDFRHTAPKGVTMKFYQDGASTSVGGSAVAVPGQMKGLGELHSKYGLLPWKDLITPSISLARDGVEVCEDLRTYIKLDTNPPGISEDLAGTWYESDPMYHSLFKNGKVLAKGDLYQRPEYARTLEIIADRGPQALYEGDIAEAIITVARDRGGLMTMDDLKEYTPIWREPISLDYRGNTLWTVPAPASGAIWLSAMGTLGQFDPAPAGSVLDYHRVTEALRLAYGQRTELGDPAFVPGLAERQNQWISPRTVGDRAKMLSDERTFPPEYYKPPNVEIKEDHGTSNITVADETGFVVSITTTVGLNWGSRIMVPGYGFVINDSMDDFSVKGRPNGTGYEPTKANYGESTAKQRVLVPSEKSGVLNSRIVVGGKRPLSSSCPYIVERGGEVVLAGGAAGGSTIISANVQVVRNVLDYGLSAEEALRSRRLHNQILPNVSLLERSNCHSGPVEGFTPELEAGLRDKGHKIEWVAANRSTTCAIKFLPGPKWEAVGDPRKYDSGGSVVQVQDTQAKS